jgi:hypothetical protein
VETLESLFNFMLDGAENIQRSFYPQMALEFTLIKLATLERTVPLESIIKRLDTLSGTIKTGGEPRGRFDEPRGNYEKRQAAPEEAQVSPNAGKVSQTQEKEPGPSAEDKGSVLKYIKSRNALMATRLEQAKNISTEGGVFRITFGNPIHTSHFRKKETETELRKFLKEYFNRDMDVEIAEDSAPQPGGGGSGRIERNENKKKIQNDPALKDAIEIFGGRVVSVKPRQKE